MASVLGMLEEREAAARVRVEGLREEVAWLAEVLEAAEIELDRRVIAREELVEALAVSAAESTAVTTTEAEEEAVPSLAPVPGSTVPPWREGLPVTVLAPDYQRILGVLEQQRSTPTARRNRPSTPWHKATDALDTLHTDLTDDARAQAHITALGELIEATAQKAPEDLRAELQAASKAFARAQRSQIRSDDRAASALRTAARDIVDTATGPDGSALAALIAAMFWAAIVAGRWHAAKGHAHQADAARQTLQHLQTAADHALAPVLAGLEARHPKEEARLTLASDVRAAVPEHAQRILADSSWPALAAILADAEAGGHKPHELLKEAVAQRELATARHPARVLITRIQHTGRNPVPNRRAEAARRRTTMTSSASTSQAQIPQSPAVITTAAEQQHRQRR